MKRVLIAGAVLLFSANALADECASATTQTDLNTCTASNIRRQIKN